jgi:hypothetical protein
MAITRKNNLRPQFLVVNRFYKYHASVTRTKASPHQGFKTPGYQNQQKHLPEYAKTANALVTNIFPKHQQLGWRGSRYERSLKQTINSR